MKNLNEYMMIFRFQPNFEYQPTEEEQAAMHQQWGAFIGNLAIQEKLVSTHQLGFNGKQLNADLSITEGIKIAEGNTLGGNMIVKASSLDEAVELAKESPILKMGGSVEIREILAM